MYSDKTLVCRDCGEDFIFSAGEQEFYAEKGFQNEPTRCTACRQARKNSKPASNTPRRELFDAICSECGTKTKVPFKPSGDKPVYCRSCFDFRR